MHLLSIIMQDEIMQAYMKPVLNICISFSLFYEVL